MKPCNVDPMTYLKGRKDEFRFRSGIETVRRSNPTYGLTEAPQQRPRVPVGICINNNAPLQPELRVDNVARAIGCDAAASDH